MTDNVGVGRVEDMRSDASGARDGPIRRAIRLAEGEEVVDALPRGLETVLDAIGFDAMRTSGSQGSGSGYGAYAGAGMMGTDQEWMPHGLSGGEVRISLHTFCGMLDCLRYADVCVSNDALHYLDWVHEF